MKRTRSDTAFEASLLQIGAELIPIYGSDETGWSLEPSTLAPRVLLYRTREELFFALVNMQVSAEGSA